MKEDILIQKWLNGELSPQERREFESRADYPMMVDILQNAQAFSASNHSKPESFDDLMSKIKDRETSSGKTSWKSYMFRVAAILVVGIGLYFSFFNNPEKTISTLASEKTNFVLPDQSEVQLNALSEISFNPNEWENNRHLNLKGEAFFVVAKGQKFIVDTEVGDVRVLGTQFNVKHRTDLFEVSCYEGRVEVLIDTLTKVLYAGDILRAIGTDISYYKHDDELPSWTDNRSVFNSARIQDVISEMERQYDINIELRLSNNERTFSGGFTHDNLEEALQQFTIPLNLNFTIQPDNRVIINDIQ